MRLTACEIVEAAFLSGNNAPKFHGFGAIRAGKSPGTAAIFKALDPTLGEGHYGKDVNGKPFVKINYFLDQVVTPQTSFNCTPGTKGASSQTNFAITRYLQDGLPYNSKDYEALCANVGDYLASQYSGVSIKDDPDAARFLRKFDAIGHFKQQFLTRFKSAFLTPMESHLITRLIPGYNPVDATLLQVDITMKDAAGRFTTALAEKISALRLETGYDGQYIAIGGTKWAQWFGPAAGIGNILCCSDIGVNFQAIRDELPFEFYHSNRVEVTYGAGALILMEEGSYAAFNWLEKPYRPESHANENYGSLAVSLASSFEPSLMMELDLHAKEKGLCDTSGEGVQTDIFWSSKYEAWVKPFSFNYGTGAMAGHTGIYHFKWVEA